MGFYKQQTPVGFKKSLSMSTYFGPLTIPVDFEKKELKKTSKDSWNHI